MTNGIFIILFIGIFAIGYGVGSIMELNRWQRKFDNLWNDFMKIRGLHDND